MGGSLKGERTTYESQAVRPFGEREIESRQMEPYGADEHWDLGLASDSCGVRRIRGGVFG